MVRKKTLYDILNVEPDADGETILASYQELFAHYRAESLAHCPESRNAFIFVREAYRILSDPEKRQAYDLSLTPPEIAGFSGKRDERPRFGVKFMLIGFLGLIITAGGAYLTEARRDQQVSQSSNASSPPSAAAAAQLRAPAVQSASTPK